MPPPVSYTVEHVIIRCIIKICIMKIVRILAVPMVLLCLVAVSGKAVAQTKPPTLHVGDVPIGSLGLPVGSYLTMKVRRLTA